MTRLLYDSVTAGNIPTSAQMVAGYVDGRYRWSDADWARFPGAVKVRIAVFASTNDGHVLDVERYDATPAQAVGWVQQRRAAGVDPTVYCGYSTNGYSWALVIDAFRSAGVPEPHYWVAAYPGNGAQLYAGSVAHQYADPLTSGGNYDLSVVADYWPGVDDPSTVSNVLSAVGDISTAPPAPSLGTVAPNQQEDDMRVISSPGRGQALIGGPQGYRPLVNAEEVTAALAFAPVLEGNDRQFDLWRSLVLAPAPLDAGAVAQAVVAAIPASGQPVDVAPLLDAIKALPAETVAAIKAAL